MDALNLKNNDRKPLLASRAGTYSERPLSGVLGRLFLCSWTHHLPDGFQRRMAVVPDGCCDLIWAEGKLMVIGPDRVAAFPNLTAGETVIGLRFRPGAAFRWLDLPLGELVGKATPLSLLRDDVLDIEAVLAEAPDSVTRQKRLHLWAAEKAGTVDASQPQMEALFIHLLNGGIEARDTRAGLAERTLRRRAHDHFGYGPKTLDRVLRLQRFLKLARRPEVETLAMLALEAGYADQAHMTRDVKELTTLTPLDIRRQLST